ncbi:MAG: TIGR00730 family Rossman fold protein [Patescibacteria group bacterium]|jgi:hypothetical protein
MSKENPLSNPEADQNQLNNPVPFRDFRSGASWRIFRIMAEFIEGFEFLADLKNEVTFFGSARTRPDHPCYQEARKLGKLLGEAGYTIITGGGPGIMEAGNRGATEAGAQSVGLNIELPKEQRINPFVKRFKGFYYFFTRKVMLSASAQAYVFFPGGFGTLDEMFELIMLIQTKKMMRLPIVLVGKEFWSGLFGWVQKELLKSGYIDEDDLRIMTVVDSAEEAFAIVKESKERKYF